ncbi:hypothetical protein DL96DRAFT_1823440 [Flagelloscypha sp. PMI_526]|nr:hypothetical protein DL96DRAFT_1823440 [Flagelloscypha sp. PMI_526]
MFFGQPVDVLESDLPIPKFRNAWTETFRKPYGLEPGVVSDKLTQWMESRKANQIATERTVELRDVRLAESTDPLDLSFWPSSTPIPYRQSTLRILGNDSHISVSCRDMGFRTPVYDSPSISSSINSSLTLPKPVQALVIEEEKRLFDVLDMDVLGCICAFLTGLELCLLRRVCKSSLTFVDDQQIVELRRIQAVTNFVVSGSAAVQFFERVDYPNSDLDLYVEERHRSGLILFIEQSGYELKVVSSKSTCISAASLPQSNCKKINDEEQNAYSWDGRNAAVALSFEKKSSFGQPQKIQVIASANNVVTNILSFHSTVVMNIITYHVAIAFFPVSSFHRHQTLVTASNSQVDVYLEKYSTRGWQVIRPVPGSNNNLHQECKKGVSRWTNDRWCWTVPLSPVDECESPIALETAWVVAQRFDSEDVAFAEMRSIWPIGKETSGIRF